MPLSQQQPSVIPIFFSTEMWERFAFYMTQSLLVLYMTSKIFDFSDAKSYGIIGAFSAMAYITPILGGYAANRVLDYEHAITLGGFLLTIGYAILSLPHENLFYVALAIISIGNGFFKPSISSYLGDFYHKQDPSRERGYTVFYVGINIGVLLSTATSGYLVRYFGWHVPFLLVSIGLLIGTITFVFGLYYLKNINNFNRIKPPVARKNHLLIALVYLLALGLTIASYEIICHRALANHVMLWGGIGVFIGLIIRAFRYPISVRNKFLACIILMLISIVFWALYMQMFFSINLFTDRLVDRRVLSHQLPTPLILSLAPIYIILLGPLFGRVWQYLAIKNKNLSVPLKFSLALLSTSIAFFIIHISTKNLMQHGMNNLWFMILAYLFLAIGELLLSPIGLAMVTTLAPQELVGLMMGVWFVTLGLGVKLGSVMADNAIVPRYSWLHGHVNAIYGQAFYQYALVALIIGIFCLSITPLIKKLSNPAS